MEQLPEEIKSEIWGGLKEIQVVYLATIESDRPRVRPVTMGYYENEFWTLTGTNDAKTGQIKTNPNVELCLDLKDEKGQGYARFIGKASIVEDSETKSRVALKFPFFNEFWQTPDDPTCTLIKYRMESLEFMRPGEMMAGHYTI